MSLQEARLNKLLELADEIEAFRFNKLKDYNRQFKDPEGNVFDLYNGEKFHPLS
jgi:hypothetical protein